jgi:methionyl-tRNA formyltransferase
VKAIVFAYHDMGIAGLEALRESGYLIAAVFSHEDAPDENLWFGSVRDWATRRGIPFYCPEQVNAPEWVGMMREMAPDVIFSFYYRHLLGKDILELAPKGAFNLHGSLLPAYRGRCPVNWVLIHGESRTGVTLHHMVEKPDAGDIVGQKGVPIDGTDTARTLFGKLCRAAGELLREFLPLIRDGRAPRVPQDLRAGSYFGGRRPQDGHIDWKEPAVTIYNLIRAVTDPYPGAFAWLPDGRKIVVWWALPEGGPGSAPAGTVEVEGRYVHVRTGSGRLRLLQVEIGGRRMAEDQILAYFRDQTGAILT